MLSVNIKKKLYNYDLAIDFKIDKDFIGLMGASGSGKSMILKCIAGIETPDEGSIILNDKILFDSEKKINLKPQDRQVGYLFQNYALFPQMTVYRNIFISVRNDKTGNVTNEYRKEKTEKIMSILGIDKIRDKFPSAISGGEQQRVAIARIIVNEPDILLLDEPFSSLDVYLKLNLMKELYEIIKGLDKGVIFVSHDVSEIQHFCKDILVINDGKEVERGKVQEIIENPKSIVTKNLTFFLKNA